jgi:hypothetical protein
MKRARKGFHPAGSRASGVGGRRARRLRVPGIQSQRLHRGAGRVASPRKRASDTGVIVTLSPRDYDAVLFDLDGVLTRMASAHDAAWKKLFDAFLERHAVEMKQQTECSCSVSRRR